MISSEKIFNIYLSGRIHARRGELLSTAKFDEFLGFNDIESLIRGLLSSPYERDMADALLQKKGADAVEEAVGRHIGRTFAELAQMCKTEPHREHMMLLFTHRWDLAAIKSLIRCCGAQSADASGLATGPSLPWAVVKQLAESASLSALIANLAAMFPTLCSHLPAVLDTHLDNPRNAVIALETALDIRYFERCNESISRAPNGRIFQEYLQMEVDRINMRRLLSALMHNMTPDTPWLHGGRLSVAKLDAMMATGSVEQVLVMLGETPYRAVHHIFYQVIQNRRLSGLEQWFEMHFMERLHQIMHTRSYTTAVFMHFMWQKWIEAANLRILARGAEAHLPAGRIREEMIYV